MQFCSNLMVMIAIALGVGLGYLAASGNLRWSSRAVAKATEKPPDASDKAAPDKLDRMLLPIPEPKRAPITELDARKAKAPPRFEVKAPKGAPNVLIWAEDGEDPRLSE
jgi:hypothetical protein